MQGILIAADYCPQKRVADNITQGHGKEVFSEVIPILEESDYSIVNLEYSLAPEGANPLQKCGPNLSGSPESIKLLRDVGFDMVTLANNHIYDYGDDGLAATLQGCKDYNLEYVGAGKNLDEAKTTQYIDVKGKTFAIINCCEHEFSLATEIHYGANPLNPISQYYSIIEAKSKADYVIVIVHGGHEHYPLPSPRMVETYRFFIDSGADVVVNHHQHCFSGYEVYRGKPIFYGLGNFCFDAGIEGKSPLWFDGYMVKLIFDEDKVGYNLIPYTQCKDKAKVILMANDRVKQFEKRIKELNNIISDSRQLRINHQKMLDGRVSAYRLALEPYNHTRLKSLFNRGWLPSFMTKPKLLRLKSSVCCESHLDVIRNAVNQLIESK